MTSSPAAQLTFSHNDADEFCASTRGFDIEFRQLDHGHLKADLAFFTAPDCNVQHVKLSRRFHQRGSVPKGMITFGMPDIGTMKSWRGQVLKSPSLLNFSRPNGYDSVSENGFSAYTFALSEQLLEKELDALGSTFSPAKICSSGDWRITNSSTQLNLESIGAELVFDSRIIRGGGKRLAELQSSLAHNLARVISADETINIRANAAQRDRAIKRALELILSSSEPLTVSELRDYSGVCWRTLDRAFKDRFGISPKQYITATRLSAARRALRSNSSRQTVTEIAMKIGFTHLGRFSSNYRQMFGELPSATQLPAR